MTVYVIKSPDGDIDYTFSPQAIHTVDGVYTPEPIDAEVIPLTKKQIRKLITLLAAKGEHFDDLEETDSGYSWYFCWDSDDGDIVYELREGNVWVIIPHNKNLPKAIMCNYLEHNAFGTYDGWRTITDEEIVEGVLSKSDVKIPDSDFLPLYLDELREFIKQNLPEWLKGYKFYDCENETVREITDAKITDVSLTEYNLNGNIIEIQLDKIKGELRSEDKAYMIWVEDDYEWKEVETEFKGLPITVRIYGDTGIPY